MIDSKFTPTEKKLLALWLVVNLVIGALIASDYGMSIDEPIEYHYAAVTLDAYPSFFGTLYKPTYNSSFDGHGPAFVAPVLLLIKVIQKVYPSAFAPILWHFSYFVIFQVGSLCLYWLSRRWFSSWASWGILVLFNTQPLLWGHAFINPSDIPFMALFIASIATGFALVDGIAAQISHTTIEIKSDASTNNIGWGALKGFVSEVIKGFITPGVLAAGILLGLTTSIRILGLYAGAIVFLYALNKSTRRTLGIFPAYFISSALICYLTWPFLWGDPIGKFIQAFNTASKYPWLGSVLFEGKVIPAIELPARYLPKMMIFQFTEITIILFAAGVLMAFWMTFKKKNIELLALLLVWFLTPLSAIILSRSVVYDGFRHILFLLPPLFICTGFVFEWIFDKVKFTTLRLIVLALATLPGIFSIVTLHPYQYVYYNSFVGGTQGAYENYELDYWATSYRELALFLNETAPQDANVVILGSVGTYRPYSRPDINLFDTNDANRLKERENIALDYAVIFNRRNLLQDSCRSAETIKSIERDGAILAVLKKIRPGQVDCP